MKYVKIIGITLIISWLAASIGYAHRVIVFAWADKDMTIHVRGSFGSKIKAKNCQVTLQNQSGTMLDQAMTDDNGLAAFKLPDSIESDLIVTLDAGQGHKGSWTVTKQEIQEVLESNGAGTDSNLQPIKEQAEKKMEELEKKPPLKNIILGITLIFFLAFVLKWMKEKKDAVK